MDDATSYLHYLEMLRTQRHLSPHTICNYQLDLEELSRFAQEQALPKLTAQQIRRFTSQLRSAELHPRSIARKLSAWRGYFQWLADEHHIDQNPVEGIKAPKSGKPLPKALSVDDAVRLVADKTSDSTMALANRAMFELLYSSGLRVAELVSLDIQQSEENGHPSISWISLEEKEVHVTGKGNKHRIVPIGSHAILAIQDWLPVRSNLVKDNSPALFLNERGKRISVRSVQVRIKAHAQSVGIPADVTPHVMRHSFASHVLQSSGDLRAVQEMLGHSSISATQVYTSLDFQHLAKIYDQTHPRAKK